MLLYLLFNGNRFSCLPFQSFCISVLSDKKRFRMMIYQISVPCCRWSCALSTLLRTDYSTISRVWVLFPTHSSLTHSVNVRNWNVLLRNYLPLQSSSRECDFPLISSAFFAHWRSERVSVMYSMLSDYTRRRRSISYALVIAQFRCNFSVPLNQINRVLRGNGNEIPVQNEN